MAGGLLQLAAVGSQNQYLTGNPQMTFFKVVYRRYTNYSMEFIEQSFDGPNELDVTNSIKLTAKIGRNADLLSQMYLVFEIPDIYSHYDPISLTSYRFRWIKNLGSNIIKTATFLIEGQKIDRQYGEWMQIWNELTLTDAQIDTYNRMIGNTPDMYDPESSVGRNGFYPISTLNPDLNLDPDLPSSAKFFAEANVADNPYNKPPSIQARTLYVPLNFWFCRNPGLALPLIALQYHEVSVELELRPMVDLYTIIETKEENDNFGIRVKPNSLRTDQHISQFLYNGGGSLPAGTNITQDPEGFSGWGFRPRLDINYIYLDYEERLKFASTSHEYLIETVNLQVATGLIGNKQINLENFQNPVKQLVWVAKRNDIGVRNDWNNYTNWVYEDVPPDTISYQFLISELSKDSQATMIPTKSSHRYFQRHILRNAKLMFNGIDRFSSRPNEFFNLVQPFQHSVRGPKDGVYMYSFSLDNQKFQPSGACNMARIPNVTLDIETTEVPSQISYNENLQYRYMFDVNVYAVGYNILRIMGGMASTVFSG